MKNQHTKGTWNQCCANTTPHFVFADQDKAVCSLRCNDPINTNYNHMEGIVTNEERIANAKLIAAAPEMLEALIEIREWYEKNQDALPGELTPICFSKGLSAILKATE